MASTLTISQIEDFFNNYVEPHLIKQEAWATIGALKPEISHDKNCDSWYVRYTDKQIDIGVCGYGNTLEEAVLDFYNEIQKQ